MNIAGASDPAFARIMELAGQLMAEARRVAADKTQHIPGRKDMTPDEEVTAQALTFAVVAVANNAELPGIHQIAAVAGGLGGMIGQHPLPGWAYGHVLRQLEETVSDVAERARPKGSA